MPHPSRRERSGAREVDFHPRLAEELFAQPPLAMDDLFENSAVRLRVGKLISEAVADHD
jgi:hypothetical protein